MKITSKTIQAALMRHDVLVARANSAYLNRPSEY